MIRSTSKRQRTSIKEENLDIDNKKRILSIEGDQAAIEMDVAESSSSHSPSMSADEADEEESDDLFSSTTTKIGGTMISEKKVTKSQRIALKNMEQKLICPLCKNIMREPVTLMNCLHSFCMECLAKHYYSMDDSNDDDDDDNNNDCKNQDQNEKEQSENDTKADASKVIDGEVESGSSSSTGSNNGGGLDINLSKIIERNSVTRGDVLVCPIVDCKVPLLLYNNNNKSTRSSSRSSSNSSSCNNNSCVKKNPQLTTMISSFHGILENLSKIRDSWWNANVEEEEEEINGEGQSDEQCIISNMNNCDDDIKKNETEKECNKSENPQTILPESIDDESSITIDDKNDVNIMNNESSSISDSLTESNNGDDNNDNKEENCVIEKIERVKSDDKDDNNHNNSDVESYDSDNSDDKTIVNSYHYSQFSQFSGVTFGASK